MLGYDWDDQEINHASLRLPKVQESVVCSNHLQCESPWPQISNHPPLPLVQTCSGQFCAQHRFPTDHTCKTTTSKPRAPANSSASTQARGLGNDESPMSNAAMAAIKRSMASTKFTVKPTPSSSSKVEPPQPVQKLSSTSTSSSSKTTLNPLSATDR